MGVCERSDREECGRGKAIRGIGGIERQVGYSEIYEELNHQAEERFELMEERIAQICSKAETKEQFADYFQKNAAFLLMLARLYRDKKDSKSATELKQQNFKLYEDILPEAYQSSYANPAYAIKVFGRELGEPLCLMAAHLRESIREVFRGNLLRLTIAMELFVEVYNTFEDWAREEDEAQGTERAKELSQIFYWYFHDYSEIFQEESIRRQINPEENFETEIVMGADLTDPSYLYCYGAYIGANELVMAEFLNRLPEEKIQAMADTYTEGYRIGFEVTGKDIGKKKVVQVRYPIGFERMVRAAIRNFEKMGLKPTMAATGTVEKSSLTMTTRRIVRTI